MAAVLIGSFRKADAGDPDVFARAVIRIFTGYSSEIVRAVCDPLNGLPSRLQWLPTIAEVKAACDAQAVPYARLRAADNARAKQIAERDTGPSVEIRNMLAKRAQELADELRCKTDVPPKADVRIDVMSPVQFSPQLAALITQQGA